MVDKIIIITYQPVTKKNKIDFFVDRFIEEGFSVEFWVLSNIFHPELVDNTDLDKSEIYYLNKWAEFENRLSGLSIENTIFFPYITYEWKVTKLFLLLSKYNCKLFFLARGMLAFPNVDKPLVVRLLSKFYIFFNINTIFSYVNNFRALLLKKKNHVKPYDVIFSAGQLGYMTVGVGHAIDYRYSKIVRINSTDYDHYQEILNDKSALITETPYCVFLDEYLPYHPDLKIMNLDTVSANPYYKSLNRFFDEIERVFKLNVIVAAHPKAQYQINPFEGREIYKFETAKLVSRASLVLAHMSTSISFAVLFNKPILFFFNNEIQGAFGKARVNLIKHFASVLGSFVFNIDELDDRKLNLIKECLNVDVEKYEEYKYKYLTSVQSAEKETIDIVVSEIRSL